MALVKLKMALALGLTAILVAGTAALTLSVPAPAAVRPVDAFKRFIASPPVISDIEFVQRHPQDNGESPPDYYRGRWQPNAYVFEKWGHSPAGGADHPQSVFGKFDTTYWSLSFLQQRLPDLSINYDATHVIQDLALYEFAEAMNLGEEHAAIASIQWQDNTFYTEHETALGRTASTGRLEIENNRVARMLLHLKRSGTNINPGERTEFDWRIEYAYPTNDDTAWLPNRFTTYSRQTDGSWKNIERIEILALRTNNSTLGTNYYTPDLFCDLNACDCSLCNQRQELYRGLQKRPNAGDSKAPPLAANQTHLQGGFSSPGPETRPVAPAETPVLGASVQSPANGTKPGRLACDGIWSCGSGSCLYRGLDLVALKKTGLSHWRLNVNSTGGFYDPRVLTV